MAEAGDVPGPGPVGGDAGRPDEGVVTALALDAALALTGVLALASGTPASGGAASGGAAGGDTASGGDTAGGEQGGETSVDPGPGGDELLALAAAVRSLPRPVPTPTPTPVPASSAAGRPSRRRRRQVANLATAAAALAALGLGADQLLQPGGSAAPGPAAVARLSRLDGRLVLSEDDGRLAGRVTGVDCPTRSRCLATLDAGGQAVLARSSDGGASWRTVGVPGHPEELSAVLCTSPVRCWVVGSTAGGRGVLLATSNGGSRWQAGTVPAGVASLSDVACAGPVRCWAVGSSSTGSAAVLATTDGLTWSAQPAPPGIGPLRAVTCPTAQACWAGGGAGHAGAVMATADGGASWAVQPLPSGGAAGSPTAVTAVTAVSCTPAGNCWAAAAGGSLVLLAAAGPGWQVSAEVAPSAGLVDEPGCATTCTAGSRLSGDAALRAVEGGAPAASRLDGQVAATGAVTCPLPAQCWVVQPAGQGFTSRPVDPPPDA